MKIIKLMMLIIAVLLSACASVQTYEGKELRTDQVALIKSSQWDHMLDSTKIEEVDGKVMGFGVAQATVLPGEHKIKFRVNNSAGLVSYSTYITLSMYAEAGHTYKLDGKIYGGEHLYAWIMDETTNKIVAGKKYGEDASRYAHTAYKDTSLEKIGEYSHDKRLAIHQEIEALTRKLWKSYTREVLKSGQTSTFQESRVLELIDLDGDKKPEQFSYRGKDSSGEDTKDFGFIYDLNNDSNIDYIVFYQGTALAEDEADSFKFAVTFYHWIDTNYDGTIDTWVYPDIDLNDNGKIDEGIYGWLYDSNGDGIIDAGEYLGKELINTIQPDNNSFKLKSIILGGESGEKIHELSNKMLSDINSIIH